MSVSASDGSAVLERGRAASRGPQAGSAPAAARPSKAAASKAAKQPAAAPSGVRSVLDEEPPARRSLVEYLGVWGFAVLVHVVVLLALSFIVMPSDVREQIFSILGEPSEEPDDAPIFEAVEMPELTEMEEPSEVTDVTSEVEAEVMSEMPLDMSDADPTMALDPEAAGATLNLDPGQITEGRSGAAKQALLEKYGGNAASEQAVATALKWIAEQQRPDGSWNFNDVGDEEAFDEMGKTEVRDAPTGATAAALLAFLGAGHTHTDDGPYKESVGKGINYLLQNVRVGPAGGDYRGGVKQSGMYIQGLAAIALAEAHGMTNDRRLRQAAEAGVNFIVSAQSPVDGGWRYTPAFERSTPEVSDTSVVGWQLMALKSAQAAKIRINKRAFLGVNTFLDLASHNDGAQYGYLPKTADGAGGSRPPMDAVGLLCRMYMGWDETDKRLEKGVELLAKRGPNRNDSYYGYYATQVLHHWGGKKWEEWNAVQRDQLVGTQEKSGKFAGSWKPGGSHNDKAGGRLWVTCLSVMTLEVYYRHLPLYERGDIKVEF
ncbi:prenyltransferase/squalene oxidase repeat-containing protein [Alienimonas californiensis]|uniref:Pectic acid lyase n=1 Tax=Alienimonas californiensis TaxID=2527989 RepID=A0A517P9N4_9PLAN|nr:terpene cyclase/mutase family protein [Alienimonas californiensis]QDT16087.1 Pectic acid lyase [Alienimonas californiensis]